MHTCDAQQSSKRCVFNIKTTVNVNLLVWLLLSQILDRKLYLVPPREMWFFASLRWICMQNVELHFLVCSYFLVVSDQRHMYVTFTRQNRKLCSRVFFFFKHGWGRWRKEIGIGDGKCCELLYRTGHENMPLNSCLKWFSCGAIIRQRQAEFSTVRVEEDSPALVMIWLQ